MTITIRLLDQPEADIAYADTLFELDQQMRALNEAPYLYPKGRDFYQRCLAGECFNVLALEGDEVIGYASLRSMSPWPNYLNPVSYPEHQCALLLQNMVAPAWRGQGISKLLNQGRLAFARQQGFRYLFCTVHPDNQANIRSLQSFGFQVIEQRPMFTEQLLRNLMFLDLAAAPVL